MERHPQTDEDFLKGDSKAYEVLKMLEDMLANIKVDADPTDLELCENSSTASHRDSSFYVTHDDTAVDRKDDLLKMKELRYAAAMQMPNEWGEKDYIDDAWKRIKAAHQSPITMDKHTFIRQLERDPDERDKVRREREEIAQKFRELGNEAYGNCKYEAAIDYYTKGIEYVKDSPVLYNNRALSYIGAKNFRRAILDCDAVLMKLDEKNLRSWVYRALAYKHLGDEKNFETSVKFARKNNTKEIEYIDEFLNQLQSSLGTIVKD